MDTRRFAPAALALLMAGCAQMGGSASAPPAPSLRFAAALEGADQAVEAAILRMDGFERLALREESAIAYAAAGSRSAGFNPMASGVAETAGDALDPAFTALSDYAHILGQVAAGQPISAKPSPSGEALAGAVGTALDRLAATGRVNVPAGIRQAGLAGIAALADLPEMLAKRGGGTPTLGVVVAEAEPHVKAVTAMLRLVIGPEAGTGTRGVIRARRESLDAQHHRFLDAVRQDSRIGAGERYAIFRSVAELRDSDPAAGTLAAIVTLLNALDQAHGALALDAEDADVKVSGFEAAVARLGALAEASRRG